MNERHKNLQQYTYKPMFGPCTNEKNNNLIMVGYTKIKNEMFRQQLGYRIMKS